MNVVNPDTLLEELPGNVFADIERCLNENNSWQKLAEACINGYGDNMFRGCDIKDMQRSVSPARMLLNKFMQMNLQVNEFQALCMLKDNSLVHIHNKLVTNVPMQIYSPEEDMKLVYKLNETIELVVEVDGSPLPTCQWYHNNQVVPGQTSSTLTIDKFGVHHEGVYHCLLRQSLKGEVSEMASGKFCLSVKPTPPKIVKDLPEEITVIHHEDLELAFEVEAYPKPEDYVWYKGNARYLSTIEPKLRISHVDSLVAGQYHCEVQNDEGSCSTRKASVTVLGSALSTSRPQILRKPIANASYNVNDWVHLSCRVQCCQPVTFTCFLNNELITSDGKEIIIQSSSDKDEYECKLSYEITEDNMERLDWKLKFHFEAASSVDRVLTPDVDVKVKPEYGKKTYTEDVFQSMKTTGIPRYTIPQDVIPQLNDGDRITTIPRLVMAKPWLNARNKWALLVGNSDYSAAKKLTAPFNDMMALADELKKLRFRVLALTSLKEDQFRNALRNFSQLVQKDDYVVFYFAGHGFSVQKFDYMVPVDAELISEQAAVNLGRNEYKKMQPSHCIDVDTVTSHLQSANPALILYIYDMCRHIQSNVSSSKLPDSSLLVDAKANSYFIYATSLNYDAFEVEDGMSCLMKQLKSIIGTKVSVGQLGQRFKELFRRTKEVQERQIPRTEGDLAEPRSLTDDACPTAEDKAGVLQQWQRLSSVGGGTEEEVKMKNVALRIGVRCQHRNHNDPEGPTWIISNNLLVVVTFTTSGLLCNTQTGGKSGFVLNIELRNGKDVKKVELMGIPKEVKCPVNIYQDSLIVDIIITIKEDQPLKKTFTLEVPSVSTIFRSRPVSDLQHQMNI